MSANPTFGKYTLLKKLATGGMAEVWLSKQVGIEGFNRHVVVKRILPHLAEDPEFVQMFLNEAKIAARFNHPNIAQIYDLGETGGQYYIAMEFIHGEDLGRVMRRAWSTGQWVARHISLRMIADACQGLYYAHTRNDEQGRPLRVVHRDISPQNILVSFDGAVKVVDFGIAKASDQVSNTKSGAIKGKFAYMAPEQAAGKPLDARSDLFALGLVLYELVTGVRPLKRDSELATLQAALECRIDAPSAVAEVPPELDDIVMRALAKAPDDRYADAREFQRALEQYLLSQREMATSAEVSELMTALFADRLGEEARLGAPNPSTESSTSNPVPPSYSSAPEAVTQPPPREPVRASPAVTMDEDGNDDEATLAPDPHEAEPGQTGPSPRYDLPPGTVVPSRAYVKRLGPEGARGSRIDAPRSGDDEGEEPGKRPPPRRRGATGQAAAYREDGEGKRRGTGLVKKRSTSSLPMPEAPPRRSRAAVPESGTPSLNISAIVDVSAMKARQRGRLQALVSVLALCGAVVLLFVFKEPILALLNRSNIAQDGVPVRLSVHVAPPVTKITVVPPPGVTNRPRLDLGRSPIDDASGAFVGDTILLENPDQGIRLEHRIEAGEPNGIELINKDLKLAAVRIRTRPKLANAEVWRGNFRLGQVGINLSIYPGIHELEVRSDQLVAPQPFTLQLKEGSTNVEHTVDVTPVKR